MRDSALFGVMDGFEGRAAAPWLAAFSSREVSLSDENQAEQKPNLWDLSPQEAASIGADGARAARRRLFEKFGVIVTSASSGGYVKEFPDGRTEEASEAEHRAFYERLRRAGATGRDGA